MNFENIYNLGLNFAEAHEDWLFQNMESEKEEQEETN